MRLLRWSSEDAITSLPPAQHWNSIGWMPRACWDVIHFHNDVPATFSGRSRVLLKDYPTSPTTPDHLNRLKNHQYLRVELLWEFFMASRCPTATFFPIIMVENEMPSSQPRESSFTNSSLRLLWSFLTDFSNQANEKTFLYYFFIKVWDDV